MPFTSLMNCRLPSLNPTQRSAFIAFTRATASATQSILGWIETRVRLCPFTIRSTSSKRGIAVTGRSDTVSVASPEACRKIDCQQFVIGGVRNAEIPVASSSGRLVVDHDQFIVFRAKDVEFDPVGTEIIPLSKADIVFSG